MAKLGPTMTAVGLIGELKAAVAPIDEFDDAQDSHLVFESTDQLFLAMLVRAFVDAQEVVLHDGEAPERAVARAVAEAAGIVRSEGGDADVFLAAYEGRPRAPDERAARAALRRIGRASVGGRFRRLMALPMPLRELALLVEELEARQQPPPFPAAMG